MAILDLNHLSAAQNAQLNQISEEIKPAFHKLLKDLLARTEGNVAWLFTSTFSRNNYQSNVFKDLCYLHLAIRIAGADNNLTHVVAPSRAIRKDLRRYFETRRVPVSISCGLPWIARSRSFVAPYAKLVHSALTFLRLWALGDMKTRTPGGGQNLTLLTNFILKTSFDPDGRFRDRYYPGILANGAGNRTDIYFLPHFYSGTVKRKYFRMARDCEEARFLLKNDYLRLRDYVGVLRSAFSLDPRVLANACLGEVAVDGILLEDFTRNRFGLTNLYGLLNYYFVRRLKQSGAKLKMVIDWYENQTLNKGLSKGIKDFYAGVKVKGYCGALVAFDHDFHFQPTDYEIDAGVIPDKICVPGRALVKTFRRFSERAVVEPAPAYRFRHVLDNEIDVSLNGRTILVALPISYRDAKQALNRLIRVFSAGRFPGVTFNIKPHPALNVEKLIRSLNVPWPNDFHWVRGTFVEQLKKARLMIGYNSSTCLEALALGVPVIVAGDDQGFYQNPIPPSISDTLWRFCVSDEQLSTALSWFLDMTDADLKEISRMCTNVKHGYFESVNSKATAAFFQDL